MKILLDTHFFLRWITDDPRLPLSARKIIEDGRNELFLSAASGWEMAIKAKLGRIRLSEPVDKFVSQQLETNQIKALPIQMHHALHVAHLPPHHSDPFDRLLISQAQLEQVGILTADPQIAKYPVKIIPI